jgi:hypothetical protein
MRVLHHAPAEQASDMSWHAVYQRLSSLCDTSVEGDKSVDGDDDDNDGDDDRGHDSYSIPPRIDFDPFSKLDTFTDTAVNNRTKLKLIISVPETKPTKNKTASTTGTAMSDDTKTRRSNSSNGSYVDANAVVALYASIDGVVAMSDVDSMIKKKRIELRKGITLKSMMMIHAYRNESMMMITMLMAPYMYRLGCSSTVIRWCRPIHWQSSLLHALPCEASRGTTRRSRCSLASSY